jgi:hypothetical protein
MASSIVFVPFTNNVQEETFWCWAAAAANTFNSMLPAGSQNVKQQCDVVKLVKGTPFGDPCTNKDAYDELGSLNDALSALGIDDGFPMVPSFQILADELRGVAPQGGPQAGLREPICAEVDFGDATHFVAISKVDTEKQNVYVEDPWPGAGNSIEYSYVEFVFNYSYKPGVGPSGGVVSGLQKVVKPAAAQMVHRDAVPEDEKVVASPPREVKPEVEQIARKLIPQSLPDNVMAAVETGLPSFGSAGAALQKLFLDAARAKGGVRVFSPGVADVLPGGRGLNRSDEPAGWRIATATPDTDIAGDVHMLARRGSEPLPEGTPRLACVRKGPHITRMLAAIAALEKGADASPAPAKQYKLNLLFMPDLFTEALWLLPTDPPLEPAVVIPYYTLIKDLYVMTAYSEADFIKRVRPIAEKWRSFAQKRKIAASGSADNCGI